MGFYLKKKRARLVAENNERVNLLFELRDAARQQFAENVKVDAAKITVGTEEEALVKKLMKTIEQHLGDTDYTVDQLALDVGIGRTNLYQQMRTMLGITPNDFMRNVRLKRAAELLANTQTPVADIAMQVGYATPRIFSAAFKKLFGVTPRDYRNGTDNGGTRSQCSEAAMV